MAQIHQLFKLQEIDVEMRQKMKRLKEVMALQQESPELVAARERQEIAVANLQKWQSRHNELSLEVSSLRQKAKSSENRLYSGKVTNPKELSDLQQEIESLGRRADALEEEVLEALLYIEEAEAELAEAEEALAATQAKWERSVADLKVEQNEMALRLHKLGSMRKEQAAKIEAPLLKEYEQLARKLGGTAVARVRGDMCLGCRLTLSANAIKEAREGKKTYCSSCGRIILPY